MPLHHIVVIVLRLFSLFLLVQGGLVGLASTYATMMQQSFSAFHGTFVLWSYAIPIAYVATAVILWKLAPFVARNVTPDSRFDRERQRPDAL